LKAARLRERVGRIAVAGVAALAEHRLSCGKRGDDGSGKAHCEPLPGAAVWGALYELSAAQMRALDRFEPGYRRAEVELAFASGARLRALTYRAERFTDDPVPFDWYKALMIEGAREHNLPAAYRELLEALPSRPDPRGARNARPPARAADLPQ